MCGEYGSKGKRPHYHSILFNLDFPDKVLFKSQEGYNLYISDTLSKIWGKGFVTIGEVSFQSSAYVAGYIYKKVNGEQAENAYYRYNSTTGEAFQVQPDYCKMSNQSGIGAKYYEKHKEDIWQQGKVYANGKIYPVPKFYREKLKKSERKLKKFTEDYENSILSEGIKIYGKIEPYSLEHETIIKFSRETFSEFTEIDYKNLEYLEQYENVLEQSRKSFHESRSNIPIDKTTDTLERIEKVKHAKIHSKISTLD